MNLTAKRILSIDVMRGLTLFLMLFVNDLYVPGVPDWLTHRPADYDGMGLADWVFPGFLFMVGMSVPFAIQSRIKNGEPTKKILFHILLRTISLLLIGVLMMNTGRLNPELSGISKNAWAIAMYVSVFLIWNIYPVNRKTLSYLFKGVGILMLILLVFMFRSGTSENPGWLITGWWGILGLIGWGYLVTSLVYLAVKDNLPATALFWLAFVVVNIMSMLNLTDFLSFLKPVFGVVIEGNVPSMVLAGLFFSLLLRKLKDDRRKFIMAASILGVMAIIAAFILRNWFIISKINGTPSWGMLCSGISILVFVILFILIDVWEITHWSLIFRMAGQNSLTTYLVPDIIYYSIWMSGLPILFYKHSEYSLIVIFGSIVWSLAMILFTRALARIGIRLKL